MPRAFRPRYWPGHLVTLVAVLAAILLGQWQLGAWEAEREAAALDLTREEPRPLDEVMGPDEPFSRTDVGRPALLKGYWLPESTVVVSGRRNGDREGFWVATALAIGERDGPALFTVRGWVPQPGAAPEPPTGRASFVAWLQPAEGTGEVDDDPTDGVLPQVRIGDLIQHVDQDLYGAYAVVADEALQAGHPLDNPGTQGLERTEIEEVPQVGSFNALQNLLYAFEWWAFGLLAGYMWWRWVRDDLPGGAASVGEAAQVSGTDDSPERDGMGAER